MQNLKEFKVKKLEERLEMKKWNTSIENDPCGLSVDPDCGCKE